MITIKLAIVGFITGILLSTSWIIFIDGQTQSPDRFNGTHIIPPLIATLAAILVNLTTVETTINKLIAKIWVFIWFTVSTICIGAAIYILATDYPSPNVDNYPGVCILLQTVIVFMAGILFFIGRKNDNTQIE